VGRALREQHATAVAANPQSPIIIDVSNDCERL